MEAPREFKVGENAMNPIVPSHFQQPIDAFSCIRTTGGPAICTTVSTAHASNPKLLVSQHRNIGCFCNLPGAGFGGKISIPLEATTQVEGDVQLLKLKHTTQLRRFHLMMLVM